MDGGVNLPKDFLDEIIASMFHFVVFVDKEMITDKRQRTLMEIVEIIPGGYRTIIRFDRDEFAASGGMTRRWSYENLITEERLSTLAFSGGKIKPEYKHIAEKHLFTEPESAGHSQRDL
jgi:pilus assembly protein CpaF